jgi:flagellar basal-body rod protein FlgG
VATARIYTQGNLQQTGNNLDLAIKGDGFFQIQMPDGTTAYTRDGSFQLDANGQMVTNNGYTCCPASPSRQRPEPDHRQRRHGQRDAAGPGHAAAVGQLQLASFVNPAGLDPRARTSSPRPPPAARPTPARPSQRHGRAAAGLVETSNVNVVEELVQMIQTQRAYELNSKAVQTSDQMLQKLAQI